MKQDLQNLKDFVNLCAQNIINTEGVLEKTLIARIADILSRSYVFVHSPHNIKMR